MPACVEALPYHTLMTSTPDAAHLWKGKSTILYTFFVVMLQDYKQDKMPEMLLASLSPCVFSLTNFPHTCRFAYPYSLSCRASLLNLNVVGVQLQMF